MDPITQQAVLATAGAAGGDSVYVDDVFSTFLYPGSATAQTISNGIDLSTEGGLVWMKSRTNTSAHALLDSERSWSGWLESNSNNPSVGGTYISANTDGFTFSMGNLFFNGDPHDYTSWTFRKAPGFFDIVTWAGNSVSGRQIAHNLGSAPGFIMVKSYVSGTGGTGWMCYHRSLGNTKAIRMDNGSAATSASSAYWNNTDPTSTHFTVGNNEDINTSANSRNYVAYVFAHDEPVFGTNGNESIIKCGSYTGNNGIRHHVNLGFEPQWVLTKNASRSAKWSIWDNMRGVNVNDTAVSLHPNTTEADWNQSGLIEFDATGFYLNSGSDLTNWNTNDTFIYVAIRRPHKPPEVGTDVFSAITATASTGTTRTTGFPSDLHILSEPSRVGLGATYVYDRIRGLRTDTLATGNNYNGGAQGKALSLISSAAQNSNSLIYGFNNTGFKDDSFYNGYPMVWWDFKRAPGFFDIVAFTASNTSTQAINHNLGAVPELFVVKKTDGTSDWQCYHKDLGNTKYVKWNTTTEAVSSSARWNNTTPTATQFTLGGEFQGTSEYVVYLFATLSGISKVGSYSGTGNNLNVDCGFSSGARFILIKRTDTDLAGTVGNWYAWDTARGIVNGNDPYLQINNTSAQVTNTDYIDPLSSGFTVTSSAPAGLNASGGTYIFLAIA